MGKFTQKLQRFMYGRYGVDRLFYVLFAVSLILSVIIRFITNPIAMIILYIAETALLVIAMVRFFSRNIYRRRKEEEMLIKIWRQLKAPFRTFARNVKDYPTHIYRKCPYCKANLRLPRRRGKHTVNCPKCHERFNVFVVWGKK